MKMTGTMLMAVSMIGLFVATSGCSSLRPPTEAEIAYHQQQLEPSSSSESNLGLYVLWYALYGFGIYLGQAGDLTSPY
jgi:hypothetical protein